MYTLLIQISIGNRWLRSKSFWAALRPTNIHRYIITMIFIQVELPQREFSLARIPYQPPWYKPLCPHSHLVDQAQIAFWTRVRRDKLSNRFNQPIQQPFHWFWYSFPSAYNSLAPDYVALMPYQAKLIPAFFSAWRLSIKYSRQLYTANAVAPFLLRRCMRSGFIRVLDTP